MVRAAILSTVAMAGLAAPGCEPSNSQDTPARASGNPSPGPTSSGRAPQSSLGQAKRQAENTVEKVQQAQEDLNHALEDE